MKKKLPWYKRWFTTQSIEEVLNPTEVNMDDEPPSDPSEPWVTIKGTGVKGDQISLELDWNDAFIEYLRKNGFNGVEEEQMVLQYVSIIHRNLMTEMKDDVNPFT